MKVIGIIPARSGSKGIKDKNLSQIDGKSLIRIAVETGLGSSLIDDIYISSDSEKYVNEAVSFGALSNGLRPSELSGDQTRTIEVVLQLLKDLGERGKKYDLVVLLQPTSPIRSSSELDKAIRILNESNSANSLVSVSKLEEPHPYKLKRIDEATGELKPFLDGTTSEISRQMLPSAYVLTGSIYVTRINALMKSASLLPSPCLPFITDNRVNIDTIDDLDYLKYLISNNKIAFDL